MAGKKSNKKPGNQAQKAPAKAVEKTVDAVEEVSTPPTKTTVEEIVELVKDDSWVVAKGKAVTSLKGMLSDGDVIKPEYLGGGMESLDKLIDTGFVVIG